MISEICVRRPRLAAVISIVLTVAGILALVSIPIAQYPEITPPVVQVTATYPGADAATIANTVGGPIEEQVNGVEDMIYMSSVSSSAGTYTLSVSFDIGTDPDIAQVNVQNRVSQATSKLPAAVVEQGVVVQAQSTNMLLVINVFSPDGSFDPVYLSNYTSINIRDPLARVEGVGAANLLGELDYSMRIWLNPDKMSAIGLSPQDVVSAIQAQNIQAALGQIGGPPIADDQVNQYTITAIGQLETPAEFEQIIVRTGNDGAVVRVGDIARVELGAQTYTSVSRLNGAPAATLAIYQAPGANALAVAEGVQDRLAELKGRFPEGIDVQTVYDSTLFVSASIEEITHTLVITGIIVLLVVFVFLESLRATLIPAITIPVSLIGVFIFLLLFGFSLNTISMFAVVLAIGLVVDDAIVVVENVTRVMEEEGLPAPEATIKAMKQVTGPIVSTTLVLFAVFGPVSFFPGITGELFRQFAVTISMAVFISMVNALTLSPALCSLVLRPPKEKKNLFFRTFNKGLDKTRSGYVSLVGLIARRSAIAGILILVVGGIAFVILGRLPGAFIPNEDQGVLFVDVSLESSAALPQTEKIMAQVEQLARKHEGVANVVTVSGYSLLSGAPGSNNGLAIIVLNPWDERTTPETSLKSIYEGLSADYAAIPAANVFAFPPPAIPGLGSAAGFDYRLEAIGGQSPSDMSSALRALIIAANADPRIALGLFELQRRRAAGLPGGRPHQGAGAAGLRPEPLQHAAGAARLDVRQQLHLPGPHLPGERPGRPAIPRQDRGHRPPLRPLRHWRHGAGVDAGLEDLRFRPEPGLPLQPVHVRAGQRRRGAGATPPATPWRRWRRCRPRPCRRATRSSGRACPTKRPTRAAPSPRCSAWRCCSATCSWWPSTKAGRSRSRCSPRWRSPCSARSHRWRRSASPSTSTSRSAWCC